MATKLSDILNQESSGIMFPFKAGVKPVKTEQQVYTPTDGIMNVKGMAYEGPDATITYGSEEQGFPRQLKEIEKGMLPQFDQTKFPDKGMGRIETPVPTTEMTSTVTEPDKPIMDPCPPGFKLDPIKKICVPIVQPKSDTRQVGPTNPPRNIGPAANAVSKVADEIYKLRDKGGVFGNLDVDGRITLEIDNSSILSNFGFLGKFIDEAFIRGPADKKFLDTFGGGKESPYSKEQLDGIAVTKIKDGKLKATFNQKGRQNFDNIATGESLKGNLASTQKKDSRGNIILADNGQPMIVGPIRVTPFGTTGGTTAPKKKMDTRNFAERRALLMRDRTKKPTTGTTKPGTKSAPKKKGSSGTSGPPKGTRFSNVSRTKTANTGSGSSKAFSARGINRPGR